MQDISETNTIDRFATSKAGRPSKRSWSPSPPTNSPPPSRIHTSSTPKKPNMFTPAARKYAAYLDENWSATSWKAHSNIKEMLFLLMEAKAAGEEVSILENPNASADQIITFIVERRNRRIDDSTIKGKKQGKLGRKRMNISHPCIALTDNAPITKKVSEMRSVLKSKIVVDDSDESTPQYSDRIVAAAVRVVPDSNASLIEDSKAVHSLVDGSTVGLSYGSR